MPIKSRDLLDQIADLQLAIEGFSFEQLSVEEARTLKTSFDHFRNHLEAEIWKPARVKGGAKHRSPSTNPKNDFMETNSLIATVSHDIRTPLNGIMGYTDLLRETGLNPDQTEYLEAISSASSVMMGIISELLLFTRLKAGREPSVEMLFEPLKVLEQVREFVRMLLGEKDISFDISVEGELPEVLKGDPSKLSQVLMNLLGNAVKFVSRGSINLKVMTKEHEGGCILFIEVTDTGIGISADELPHIFKPYYQARQSPEIEVRGDGLGLSIVQKLIQQQGGSIQVESTPGSGTSFHIRMPYTTGKNSELLQKQVLPESAGELRGARILVFEDNPLNMKLLETRLKNWGCVVYNALKAPLGLSILKERPIDLILMDLRMPGMDGFEVSRRIRSNVSPVGRRIPIIAVTADFTAEDNRKFKSSGIDDLILKPYDSEELLAKLIFYCNKERKLTPEKSGTTAFTKTDSLVSLEYLEKECLGDTGMLEELVWLLNNNLLEFAGRMRIYLQQADYTGIQETAHKIKSGLKMIRATSLLDSVEAIHRNSMDKKNMTLIDLAYKQFLINCPLVQDALEIELKKRKDHP